MTETTKDFITTALNGYDLLADSQLNKGAAFSEAERDAFDLHGLLPPNVTTLDEQVSRGLQALRAFETDLERYAFLSEIAGHQRDPVLRAACRQSGGAAADRLHAHGRRGLPAVQSSLSQAARAVPQLAAQGSHRADPGAAALRPGGSDRGDRWRAHPWTGRSGRRRHGHTRSANWRFTPVVAACIRARPFPSCLMSARTIRIAWRIHSMSVGAMSACAARTMMISSRPSSARSRSDGPMSCCNGRISPKTTRRGCSMRYRDRLCTFNDDIQGTAAVATGTLFAAINVTGAPLTETARGGAGRGLGRLRHRQPDSRRHARGRPQQRRGAAALFHD